MHSMVITVIIKTDCVKPGRGLNAVLVMAAHQLNGFQSMNYGLTLTSNNEV